ncbi:MAG TPA: HAD family hydrolase [Candidatus Nanoarchaeia archaeon]|nr:HAD family hydrolase [Candidatus Nanoarchaeia archaeon]
MTIKAVIFDLDGTIAAFNLDYKALRAEVRGYLIKMGVPPSVLSIKENMFDMLKKADLLLTNAGKPAFLIKEIREESFRIADKYESEAASQTSLLPGAVETLKTLQKKGLKIGLCTNNSERSTRLILERFKLTEYFAATIPRDSVGQMKPNPEHCEAVVKALDVSVSEVVFVGDSPIDMQCAKELKAIAVGLPTGISTQEQLSNQGANYIITSIVELPLLIERINRSVEDLA